jgi:hypothetical protein
VIAALQVVTALVIGLFLGWVLTVTYALAAISRSQERMQRKINYWRAETAHARSEAEQLARILTAREASPGQECQ